MSTVAKQLLKDVNDFIETKRALKTFIKEMGYVFSKRCVFVKFDKKDGSGSDRLIVHELLHEDEEDREREVGFCFLYDREAENGVILPFPYSKYASLTKKSKASES